MNDGGNFTTKADITGSYQPDNSSPGTGRGTAIINGLNYVYYVIDGQHAQFMETDPDQVIAGTNAGEAVAQQIGTPNNTSAFNSSSFVFVMGGSDSSLSPFTRGGRFTATGGSVASILLDENDAGSSQSVPKSGVLSGGTITLDGDNSGRGTLTFTDTVNNTGTYRFVFYLSSATQGVIQDVTTVQVGGSCYASGCHGRHAAGTNRRAVYFGRPCNGILPSIGAAQTATAKKTLSGASRLPTRPRTASWTTTSLAWANSSLIRPSTVYSPSAEMVQAAQASTVPSWRDLAALQLSRSIISRTSPTPAQF